MSLTIVFTGPSLSINEAKEIFPHACYHEPVQCGDIIKAIRLGAKKIVIIDGYFEQRGAVWHKEILFALSQGVTVYGASSMGALRASELDVFGMIGYGKIYELYRDGETLDDDEVALVHSDDQFDSIVTPMVNVRATLEHAIQSKRIEQSQAVAIIEELKSLPYFNRSLFSASQDEPLNQWFKDHYIDQKKLDAISLLKHIDKNEDSYTIPRFESSLFFNKIYREMLCEPLNHSYKWLSPVEQNLTQQKDQLNFKLQQRLAKLMHLNFDRPDFNSQHDAIVEFMTAQAKKCKVERSEMMRYLLIESGSYEQVFSNKPYSVAIFVTDNAELHQLIDHVSTALMSLIQYMQAQKFHISERFAQRYADQFRRDRQLLAVDTTFAWMEKQDLKTQEDFESLIAHLAPLHHIVDNHNAHSIGLGTSLDAYNWLALALSCTSMTETATHQ